MRSREPYASLLKNNPWLLPPRPGAPLERGAGRYYGTTVARKQDHWKDLDLPHATKDILRLRKDMHEWGFCLIEDAFSTISLLSYRVASKSRRRPSAWPD